MAFYYHTNSIALICDDLDLGFRSEKNRRIASEFDSMKSMSGIKSDTMMTLGIITNGPMVDIGYTRLKIDDIQKDLRAIKTRMGIY